jgi:hypothetical protein
MILLYVLKSIIKRMGRITYNYGYKQPLLPPVLQRTPIVLNTYTQFLHIRNFWIVWHIRLACQQRDTPIIIQSASRIQKAYRTFYKLPRI